MKDPRENRRNGRKLLAEEENAISACVLCSIVNLN